MKTRSKSKAKAGQVIFANGAIAEKGLNPKNPNLLTIVTGPTKGNSGPRGMKRLSPKAAAAAFNKFYSESDRYTTPKARQAAITRDLCHSKTDKTVKTNKYSSIKGRRTGPLTFDYPGVDDGSRCPTGPARGSRAGTAAMKSKMAALRAKKQNAGGKRSEYFSNSHEEIAPEVMDGSKFKSLMSVGGSPHSPTMNYSGISLDAYPNHDLSLVGGKGKKTPLESAADRAKAHDKCFYNSSTMRCAKGPFEGASNPNWCAEGKSGVCKKSPLGKRRAEKNPELVKRGAQISKLVPLKLRPNVDLSGSLRGATLCKDMNEKDCKKAGKIMGCKYGKMGRVRADGSQAVGCHQQHVSKHVGEKLATDVKRR